MTINQVVPWVHSGGQHLEDLEMRVGTPKSKKISRKILQGQRGIPGPPGPAGVAGRDGAKGDTGAQGIGGDQGLTGDTGPRGIAGGKGLKGQAGSRGAGGPRGYTGSTGAIGPAGRAITIKEMAKQVHYIDRSIENIYNEMGSHITRMTQLQRELDSLRDTVRQLVSRSAK